MRNTLTDLHNYLFEALERLTDDSLTKEELRIEIQRANAIANVAESILDGSNLALKVMSQGGVIDLEKVPVMLSVSE